MWKQFYNFVFQTNLLIDILSTSCEMDPMLVSLNGV